MAFDEHSAAASLEFEDESVSSLHGRWLRLMDLAVWGELKTQKIGAVPRLRKRILEIGEALRSLFGHRDWIPKPRDRIKGALGASMSLRESLLNLERAAKPLDGGEDFPEFEQELLAFRRELLELLERHEPIWAELLDAQDEDEDDSVEDG